MTNMNVDPPTYRQVLGNYPTGVCAITALASDGSPIGMVVGSFTSVSLDPPLVGFLPDRKSRTWPLIEAAGRFCVNIFAANQGSVCRQIAGSGSDKFAEIGYVVSENGVPVITECLAHIECEIVSVIEAGDHYFVLGSVLSLKANGGADPMLFFRGGYGTFALA